LECPQEAWQVRKEQVQSAGAGSERVVVLNAQTTFEKMPCDTCRLTFVYLMAEAGDEAESVEAVVNTVNLMFTAFSNSDSTTFSSLVDPDCRFVRTAYADDGSPDVSFTPTQPPSI
jgi:hypothetical protein